MDKIIENLGQYCKYELNKSLKEMTTFHIGGNAKYVLYPNNLLALIEIINYLNNNHLEYKVFGNGSNILCSDNDFDGVIIKLNHSLNDHSYQDEYMIASAGCSIIALANDAKNHDLSGLEFAGGIPGTLGGCIYNNAGAYKSEIGEIVEEVTVLQGNKITTLTKNECNFQYRHSIFKENPDWIIISAKLKLTSKDRNEIYELMRNRQERRMQSQPLDFPSAGSTFKNPENKFAWQLIDEIGYRGKKVGGAMVSDKHSNFIINYNNASAQDVDTLIKDIKNEVKRRFNIDLTTEVEKFNWTK